jgi:hypothetical protein
LNRSLLDHLGPPPQKEDRLSLFFKPQVSGHAMLARREVITEMAFRRFHHYDWLISLEAMFSTGITYVDDAIVYHRIHGGNQINSNRADLGKLLPQSIGWALNWSTRRRFHFLERLEHVGCSPLVAEPARVAFHRLGMQCRSAWFDKGNCKSISPGSLRKLLCISLKPYSGSENDWKVTVHNIDSLMHARFHPQTLYCLSKEILKIFRRDSTGLGK